MCIIWFYLIKALAQGGKNAKTDIRGILYLNPFGTNKKII